MREKITIPIFVAMAVGGGIAFGTAGLASASTDTQVASMSTESPRPYPPRATSTSSSNVDVHVDIDPEEFNGWHRRHHGCGHGCHNHHRELPMTGAPVKALAAAGAGMLLMGTAGTLIAMRRRRSYSAK
jgi:LPXTG-motif cell wall-anchored protein